MTEGSHRRPPWLRLNASGRLGVLLLLAPLVAGGQPFRKVQFPGGVVPNPQGAWQLVFHDEFNGSSLDTSKWISFYPYGPEGSDQCSFCRTHGQEGQVYLDRNVVLQNGIAALEARRETVSWMEEQREYSSGMIHTRPPWKFRFGRFEARCRLPNGMGFWPAFWLYGWGENEIDVFEAGTQFPDLQYTNLHRKVGDKHHEAGSPHYGPDFSSDFHVFALEWDPWVIRWLVDGREIRRITRFNKIRKKAPLSPGELLSPGEYLENDLMPEWPLDIILNLAVGVTGQTPFTESPEAGAVFPKRMEIDYVRVYQRPEHGASQDLCAESGIEGPAFLKGPSLFRFTGPFACLQWEVSDGLVILYKTVDGVVAAPRNLFVPAGQWIKAVTGKGCDEPCPPVERQLDLRTR